MVVAVLLVLALVLATGCNALTDPTDIPAGCRSNLIIAVHPAEHRIEWLLPSGVVAESIQVRVSDRTSTLPGSITSLVVDASVESIDVRAKVPDQLCPVCNHQGHFLESSSDRPFVDYYRCGYCGYVWSLPKQQPEAPPKPFTPPPKPTP